MDKCCRWCHNYDNKTGYCNHDDMFDVEERSSRTDITTIDFASDSEHEYWNYIDELGFRVINPETFSCCYWE